MATRPTIAATSSRDRGPSNHPFLGRLELFAGPDPSGAYPELLFCDNDTNLERLYGVPSSSRWPKDGINDHVVAGRRHRQSGATGHQVCGLVPADGGSWRDRQAATAPASGRRRAGPGDRSRRGLHPGGGATTGRGRRVLRRTHACRSIFRRSRGHAPGVRRHALEQAVLQLQRGPLAGRRPEPATASGAAAARPQRPMAQLRGLRRDVDARHVGIPVVRGMGHGVSLRRAGARRSGVREVPTIPAVPRVVSKPQRRLARLRVGLQRCQPAGTGVGCAGSVRHRRRPRLRLPQPHLRQAAGELHLVGEPRRRQRLQPF